MDGKVRTKPKSKAAPELNSGDRMSQPEFHRIYKRMARGVRAELVGGIVYMASPLKRAHGDYHLDLASVIATYRGATPGVGAGDNTTIILGKKDEPQPDLYLRILPEHGGQSGDTPDGYIEGAPEFVAEVANSSRAIDLYRKRLRYAKRGVLEYIVVSLRPKQIRWFDLKAGQELAADSAGVIRSFVFPGLWIDGAALLQPDFRRLMSTLQQGLATSEHAAFVQRLAVSRIRPSQ